MKKGHSKMMRRAYRRDLKRAGLKKSSVRRRSRANRKEWNSKRRRYA